MWRRSGFWTTSLQSLDLDSCARRSPGTRRARRDGRRPTIVDRAIPERPRAGRIVQTGGEVVHVELDPALAERA